MEGEGEREEGKRENYPSGFSLKKPFKPRPGWPWVGAVPYQALFLFRFSCAIIRACVKVRKGEGEPGYKARDLPNSSKVSPSSIMDSVYTLYYFPLSSGIALSSL